MTSIPTSEFQALKGNRKRVAKVHPQNFSFYTHNSEIKRKEQNEKQKHQLFEFPCTNKIMIEK